ncbi:hypothetical protein M9Y10_034308 [Tritrichomonas musculus]|uniref:Zinc knuckle family protein n=1 Tax=Tritrichomonas musculus TaxID=1915356 RepID=A0ABR2KF64_9EUKA
MCGGIHGGRLGVLSIDQESQLSQSTKENELKYRNAPGRHCSICHGINHQNRSCPIRKKAQEYYQQSNFI